MSFHKNLITVSIFAVIAPNIYADDQQQQVQTRGINVQVHPLNQSAQILRLQITLLSIKPFGTRWSHYW
jgi:hypothetical protein